MKLNLLILPLILLVGCTNSTNERNCMKEKKYRDYDFTILISVEKSGNDFDYIINRKYYEFGNNNKFKFQDKKLLEEISYEYKARNNSIDKIAIDTTKYALNNQQLDKLYLLTTKLFNVDTLNFTNDTIRKEYNYDGYYAEVTLSKYNTTYKIRINGLSEKSIIENYKNLLFNIENMKIESKHKAIEIKEKRH